MPRLLLPFEVIFTSITAWDGTESVDNPPTGGIVNKWKSKAPVAMHRSKDVPAGAGYPPRSGNQKCRMPGCRKTHAPLAGRGEPPGGSQ